MNKNTPLDYETVKAAIDSFRLPSFDYASIRDIVNIANKIEQLTGESFVRLEIGSPGFPPEQIGLDAELKAIKAGVSAVYPPLHGIAPLKDAASKFIKAFINTDLAPEGCVPTCGSMQGCFAAFLLCGQCREERKKVLFIDPGFPVQKLQLEVLGMPYDSFDTYEYRGERLSEKVESYLKTGEYCAMLYSNPNNPAWTCLTEDELAAIGHLSQKYDVTVIEDLAYFGMDFRTDISKPYQPPYQPSVSHYTDNYILMISGSKAFSYAGQRIAVVAMSDQLYAREFDGLKKRYGIGGFGTVYTNRILYTLSAGTAHSAQHALAAMFNAAVNNEYNFLHTVYEYGRRAEKLKKIFTDNGFYLVYDKDVDRPLGDGFYFTIGYPGKRGIDLVYELLFYGVSAIALNSTGSKQEGLRICTSFVRDEQYALLEERMKCFHQNNRQ
ncbi:MAG: pyridoxal phosphate-dependent aminotransferase [Paludibacteraceae bacterium]|nr:pyridoxal phosphate-dependent aminotransferase [Paludibacteraceae bacterium]